jgi:hypothetical protein
MPGRVLEHFVLLAGILGRHPYVTIPSTSAVDAAIHADGYR